MAQHSHLPTQTEQGIVMMRGAGVMTGLLMSFLEGQLTDHVTGRETEGTGTRLNYAIPYHLHNVL